MKTINESYTKKQRIELAGALRYVARSLPERCIGCNLRIQIPVELFDYLNRVLAPHIHFKGWAEHHCIGDEPSYWVRDAFFNLAHELSPV